jgi:endoribonuclease LACTB2
MARRVFGADPMAMQITIVNVGYRSTNYWVLSAGRSRLVVDLGWPGTRATMRSNLNRMGLPLEEIRFGLATHYHMDHAGLAQEFKQAGVPLLVLETQVSAIPLMKAHMKPRDRYIEITMDGNVVIAPSESRTFLGKIGIAGEILSTPGHSEDSVSLLLDDGSVFTGDLTHPSFADEGSAAAVAASWRLLRQRGDNASVNHAMNLLVALVHGHFEHPNPIDRAESIAPRLRTHVRRYVRRTILP